MGKTGQFSHEQKGVMELVKPIFFFWIQYIRSKNIFWSHKNICGRIKKMVWICKKNYSVFSIVKSAQGIFDWLGLMASAEARLSLGQIFFPPRLY